MGYKKQLRCNMTDGSLREPVDPGDFLVMGAIAGRVAFLPHQYRSQMGHVLRQLVLASLCSLLLQQLPLICSVHAAGVPFDEAPVQEFDTRHFASYARCMMNTAARAEHKGVRVLGWLGLL